MTKLSNEKNEKQRTSQTLCDNTFAGVFFFLSFIKKETLPAVFYHELYEFLITSFM